MIQSYLMLCRDRRVPSATIHLSLSSPSIRKRGTANLDLWVVHVKMLIPFSVEESAEASFAGKIGLEKRFYKFCTWSECDKLEDHQKCKCDLCGFPSCERHECYSRINAYKEVHEILPNYIMFTRRRESLISQHALERNKRDVESACAPVELPV